MKLSIRIAILVLVLAPAWMVLGACKSNAESGALIGAGAGALGGYVIGNEMDK